MPIPLRVLAALLASAALAAGAADDTAGWPSRPLTFVVPFTPGGITDSSSRHSAVLRTRRSIQRYT